MATTFRPHPNNCSSTLASAYTAGSGSLVLAPGTGANFGSTFPITVTAAKVGAYGTPSESNTVFNVTGRTTDTLTGVTAAEGTTDQNFSVGDRVEVRWTSGLASALETAVNNLENSSGISGGVIAPARLGNLTPSNMVFLRGDSVWAPEWVNQTFTASGSVLIPNSFIQINATSGNVVVTLPAASSCVGNEFVFYRIDNSANTATIQRAGSDTFQDGTTSKTLTAQAKFLRVINLGGFWFVVGSN